MDEIPAQALIATLLKNEPTSTTLQDGLIAAVTCFAIDDAADSGTVVDLQSYWDRVDG